VRACKVFRQPIVVLGRLLQRRAGEAVADVFGNGA
jgi:hypothetical protein